MNLPARDLERTAGLGIRARCIGTVAWSSFLAACVATMICFAFIDPEALRLGEAPAWWSGRQKIYALGFFFFWLTSASAAALTLYLARTERAARDRS